MPKAMSDRARLEDLELVAAIWSNLATIVDVDIMIFDDILFNLAFK